MYDTIKIRISSFVSDVLRNDAFRFKILKNGSANLGGLLNKLLPLLVELRKKRRKDIENILCNEYNREDSESIYSAVNTVIDRVYFDEAELHDLTEDLHFRFSKENLLLYDEIKDSETVITGQDVATYARGLLNEYCLLPPYKRELILFSKELEIFCDKRADSHVVIFRDKLTNERFKVFAYDYHYGNLYDQNDYCICYDLEDKNIKAVQLCRISSIRIGSERFKPTQKLKKILDEYLDNMEFDKSIYVEDEIWR